MLDFLGNLTIGFGQFADPMNLLFCFVGVLMGTLVGVLPGLGPLATISMLLPVTFGLSPIGALIMLAGIYYGAQYGGSTTAILINLPGEATSVVTAIDGHQMARQGRAGVALATAALSSFFAGCVATLLIALLAPPLAHFATLFGPVEYTSLLVLGLLGSVVVASGSLVLAVGAILFGMLVATTGLDLASGLPRFTFGSMNLVQGFDLTVVAMGFFGLGEIMSNLQQSDRRHLTQARVGSLMPTRGDLRKIAAPVLRGTSLGSILGVLPGGGALLGSFVAYAVEKRVSPDRARFGKGAIQGVAAPEAANNAAAQTSFIPMLTLGVPSNAVMALMVGALIIQGIQPGPTIITQQPALFWGVVASMWVGNLMLLALNLPLVGLWARLARVPYALLYLIVLIFCAIGVYTVNNSTFDVMAVAGFGAAGFLLSRIGCEPAPFIMGFLLGPLLEENFRRSMVISQGDLTAFLLSPISAVLLAVAAAGLILAALPRIRQQRDLALQED